MSNRWINDRVNLTVLCTATYTTDYPKQSQHAFLHLSRDVWSCLGFSSGSLFLSRTFQVFPVLLLKHINIVKC